MAEERPSISLQDASLESIYYNTEDGKYYRRVSLTGELVPVGAQNFIKMAEVEVNDTSWVEVTAGLRTTRNGIRIQNRSQANPTGSADIFINGDQPSGHIGEIIHANDVSDFTISNVPLYVKAKTGSGTFKIIVSEIG